jgi:hypothetical protein
MEAFSKLVCGDMGGSSEAARALNHIRESIHTFSDKTKSFLNAGGDADLILFGPFSARVIMENSSAALLGRIDPFRIAYLSRFQAQSQYDHTKRAKSAFGWQGDVMSSEKDKENPWSEDLDLSKISRALFSQHVDHLFWRPAVEAALDFVVSLPATPILDEFLRIEADTFISTARGRGGAIYSQLSKGVHWEFFSSASTTFDPTTVRQVIADTFTWVCQLALVSHFLPGAHGCLSTENAVQAYSDTLEQVNA